MKLNGTSQVKYVSAMPIKPRWFVRWRRWLKPFITQRDTAEQIARGLSVGIFIAFTPTIGLQLVLAYCMATLLKASRAAAFIPVWITMPVTIPPVFAFTYWVGTWFVGGPSVGHVRSELTRLVWRMDRHEAFDLLAHFQEILHLSEEIIVPLWIGGCVIGALFAVISYPLSLRAIRRYRALRALAKKHRREKRRAHINKRAQL